MKRVWNAKRSLGEFLMTEEAKINLQNQMMPIGTGGGVSPGKEADIVSDSIFLSTVLPLIGTTFSSPRSNLLSLHGLVKTINPSG